MADSKAESESNRWQGTSTDGTATKLYINGEWITSKASKHIDVHDPSTQRVLTKVPESTQDEMTRAVDAAEQAWLGGWRDSSVLSRQRIMMK